MNKVNILVFPVIIGLFLTTSSIAQTVDVDKLPKYVVVGVSIGGWVDEFRSDISIDKKSGFKYNDELLKLEKTLEKTNTLIELLNKMDELEFDFIEISVTKHKYFQNLVFRKKK